MTRDEIRAAVAQELDARAAQEREREDEQSETTALFVGSLVLWCLLLWSTRALFEWVNGTTLPPLSVGIGYVLFLPVFGLWAFLFIRSARPKP